MVLRTCLLDFFHNIFVYLQDIMGDECFFKGLLDICKPGKLQKCGRIEKIISSSKLRGHSKIAEDLEKNKTLQYVMCHKNCISSYISETNLKAFKVSSPVEQEVNNGPPTKKLRSSVVPFNAKLHCLYHKDVCECLLAEETDPTLRAILQKRNPTCSVVTKLNGDGKEYVDILLGQCDDRNDELGDVVRDRLLGIGYDLPAAEARYHVSCQKTFLDIKPDKTRSENADDDFKRLTKLLEQDKQKMWNSHELETLYHGEKPYERSKYSRQRLISRLEHHFNGDLIILNGPGIASIVMFKTHGASTLKIIDDKEDDTECNIKKLGQNIKQEIKDRKPNLDSYAVHIDRQIASECTSEYLSDLLAAVDKRKLCKLSLPSLMVGSIVASQVNSQPTPLQIAIGILLSSQRTTIEILYQYGTCCSYNEVRRWLRSAAVVAARDKCWSGMSDNAVDGLVQVIIDNFDAVINSLNCRDECHVLAMVSTQSTQSPLDESLIIPRLTKEEMKQPIDCEPELIPYTGPKNPLMPIQATISVGQSDMMKKATENSLSRARELDFEFISEITHSPDKTPEYNGFNTRKCREMQIIPSPKSAARYHPLINGKPAAHDTVNTALQQAVQISRDANQDYVVITADLQIYRIIVNILFYQPALLTYVVALIGRMHMIMDFIAALGILLKASGLYAILKATFGSVDKMLDGKKYPHNVRALRMLAEEVLRPILLKKPDITNMEELETILDELSTESRTTKLWVDLVIKPSFIIMLYTRADHEGNFSLHLHAANLMLPYIFAAHKWNYARYGLFYIRSMQWMPEECEKKFLKGEQALRLKPGINNAIPSDQFIEMTWMRTGKSENGIIGNTQKPQTVATWVYSRNASTTLINDLRDMTEDSRKVETSHKEEAQGRMKKDSEDRLSLRETLRSCIDPLDPETHPEEKLLNIVTGHLAPEYVNVWDAVSIGKKQMETFEKSWPEGFYNPLSKEVFTFASKKKEVVLGNKVADPEAIYALCIGYQASDPEFNFVEVLAFELGYFPPALFDKNGNMRIAESKSDLKNQLGVTISRRAFGTPTHIIIDVSAFLWTLKWPSKGKFAEVIVEVKKCLRDMLKLSDVHWIQDRYRDFSPKSACRISRTADVATRCHELRLDMPIIEKNYVLKCIPNKVKLNQLMYDSLTTDEEFLKEATKNHKLIIMNDNTIPDQFHRGRKIPRMDLASSHEEADNIVTKHAIVCGLEPASRVCTITDDTDIFATQVHFYQKMDVRNPMIIQSAHYNRATFDIQGTVRKLADFVPKVLPAHALSGNDTVCATLTIGKTKAINAAKKNSFSKIGYVDSTVDEIMTESTRFLIDCYSCPPARSMTECRQRLWAQRTGKSGRPPKISNIPPTTEGHLQNTLRAHHQLCQWYAAMEIDPPEMNAEDWGYESDQTNKVLLPRPLPEGVKPAPDEILEKIRCSCSSAQPCKSTNCKCHKNGRACTMFCGCSDDATCCNPYKKKRNQDNESDNEDQNDDEN